MRDEHPRHAHTDGVAHYPFYRQNDGILIPVSGLGDLRHNIVVIQEYLYYCLLGEAAQDSVGVARCGQEIGNGLASVFHGAVGAAAQIVHELQKHRRMRGKPAFGSEHLRIGGKQVRKRPVFMEEPARDLVNVLPRNGVGEQKLDNILIVERVDPVFEIPFLYSFAVPLVFGLGLAVFHVSLREQLQSIISLRSGSANHFFIGTGINMEQKTWRCP